MKTELDIIDIGEELCQSCAYCCLNTHIPVQLDDRVFEYYQTLGLDVQRDAANQDVGVLNLGACQWLVIRDGVYVCSIYSTRPKMCKDYNCVAWAKCAGVESEIVKHALGVYRALNEA